MRLFSNARRASDLGPLPLERLARTSQPTGWTDSPAVAPSLAPAAEGFAESARFYEELYDGLRDGEVIEADPNPRLDDPVAMARELRGGGYFLNATAIGICRADAAIWYPDATAMQGHCVVIAVEWGTPIDVDNLATAWLSPNEGTPAQIRAAQIAVILAGYIRAMGRPARAHLRTGSDIDVERAAILSGIAMRDANGTLTHPLMGTRFALAALTTDVELATDLPLDAQRARGG
jgi:hypothetical protein